MKKIITKNKFDKSLSKLLKNSKYKNQILKNVPIIESQLCSNTLDSKWKCHVLTGNLKGKRELHVTSDDKIVMVYTIDGDTITLENIGNHKDVLNIESMMNLYMIRKNI